LRPQRWYGAQGKAIGASGKARNRGFPHYAAMTSRTNSDDPYGTRIQNEIRREMQSLVLRARRYVALPPILLDVIRRIDFALIEAKGGLVYHRAHFGNIFGFPKLSVGDAIIRTLEIRSAAGGATIRVGTKANDRYDRLFSSIWEHLLNLESLGELFGGAIAFTDLDAYAALYAIDAEALLQPARRKSQGHHVFELPDPDQHAHQVGKIKTFLRPGFERALSYPIKWLPLQVGSEMEYSILSYSSGEALDTVDMHVLARAYRAAWRSIFASDPVGPHVIAALDALIVFYPEGVEGDT
jgi:hypothetical protein